MELMRSWVGRALYVIAVAFVLVVTGRSSAVASTNWSDRADRALKAWEGKELEDRVRRLQSRFGIIPRPSSAWGKTELEAIERGAELLPERMRDRVTTPLFLARRQKTCRFGQGDGSSECPRFEEHGRTFYIYDIGDISNRWARRVTPGLDESQRRRLLYSRAAVHLFVAKFDQRIGWSGQRNWRAINGWADGESLNQDWWGYTRPLGRRSAHLDLVTFAEEFYVRPEDFLRRSGDATRLEQFDPNDSVACRMMTRSRFLRDATIDFDPGWSPPKRVNERALDEEWNRGGTGCPAFEEWADFEHLRGLNLIYASPSANHPESLFGHLFIHIEYGPGADVFREGLQPVFQFGAVTGREVTSAGYFLKGLFGGFPSVLEFNTLRATQRIYLRYERRTLRKFRLHLSSDQQLRSMQRIWEAERHIRYPYYFFHRNCASFIVDLFAPVLSTELDGLPRLAVMPTDVIDAFATTRNRAVEDSAFLGERYRKYFDSQARAARAIHNRRELVEPLTAEVGASSNTLDVASLQEALESMEPSERREAYRTVESYLSEDVESAVAQVLVDYLYYSSVVERYFVERARYARLEKIAAETSEELQFTVSDRLELRRDIYRIDELRERLRVWSERMQKRIAPLAEAIESAPVEGGRLRSLRQTYMSSLDALSIAISQSDEESVGEEFRNERRRRTQAFEYTLQKKAIGPSGAWRGAMGMFGARGELPAGPPRAVESRAGFELHAAFLRDEFGDVRIRGFGPDVESRSFDLEMQTWLGPEWQRRIRAEMILYRFFTLNRKPRPIRDDWRDAMGWGIDAGFRHDGARGLHLGGWLSGGLVFPLWQSEVGSDYLAFALFAAGRADHALDSSTMLGARSFLRGQLHLYGNHGNVGRLKLESHQYRSLGGRWEFDATATLSTRHGFGDLMRRPIWLVPYFEGLYTTIDYAPSPAGSLAALAGLRFEFPF